MNQIIPILVIFPCLIFGQKTEISIDSTKKLEEIVVRGFETDRTLVETSASISVLKAKEIQNFENQTLVPLINTVAGVRMEERSPGSYRLSIRGSTLRSPFGVRNVKVYWNDIPLTDGNGSTFLNALDINSLGNIEIIKGPAGSLYGAGTGGVLIIGGKAVNGTGSREQSVRSQRGTGINENESSSTKKTNTNLVSASFGIGSFGQQNRSFSIGSATEKSNTNLTYAHTQSDGYREQSRMVRDVLSVRSSIFSSDHKTLNITGLYSDIHYQTPGGLTQAQMDANRRAARPSTPTVAGPVTQKAGIYQKLFNLGLSQEYRWNSRWSNVTAIYCTISNLKNPFITNYEIRDEQTLGGRTRSTYQFDLGKIKNQINFGGEFQQSAWVIRNFGNKSGKIDTLQTNDNSSIWQYFLFGQIESGLPKDFILTLGGSYNRLNYKFLRVSDAPNLRPVEQWLPTAFSPRLALLKKLNNQVSLFGSISSGYSPPTLTEYITGYRFSTYQPTLSAEKGINYEIGGRGNIFKNRLFFDATFYNFRLKNTIVRRVDEAGREIFSNEGSTLQKGIELTFNGKIIKETNHKFINQLNVSSSLTLNDYKFENYKQLRTDFSDKKLTGVPNKVWVSSLDLDTKIGFYLFSNLNFTDEIPLNDANTVYANSYWLLNTRLGYRKNIGRFSLNFYAVADNLLDEKYSLGNDTNAAGNRFFNPAPSRNWQTGASLGIIF